MLNWQYKNYKGLIIMFTNKALLLISLVFTVVATPVYAEEFRVIGKAEYQLTELDTVKTGKYKAKQLARMNAVNQVDGSFARTVTMDSTGSLASGNVGTTTESLSERVLSESVSQCGTNHSSTCVSVTVEYLLKASPVGPKTDSTDDIEYTLYLIDTIEH